MADERLLDEEFYFQTRGEQMLEEAERRGISRRALIGAAAAGVPLLAGAGRWAETARADTPPTPPPAPPVPAGPIVKPLPPEWFTIIGTNAEMRWDSVAGLGYTTANERFFVRDHTGTPVIDAVDVAAARVRERPARAAHGRQRAQLHLLATCAGCRPRRSRRSSSAPATAAASSRAQQGTPAPGTQWKLGAVGRRALDAAFRSRHVLERAGLERWRAVDVMPEGLDSTVVVNGVDHGPRPPAAAGREGTRRRAARVRDERPAAAVRPRLSRAARRTRLGRRREHQVARADRGRR